MTKSPRSGYFQSLGPSGFHTIAYTEWGDPLNPRVVICVHGLTRNSRDFDALAAALSDSRRVVCMDVAGRGESDWLPNKNDYGFPLYLSDAAALIARVTAPAVEPKRIFRRGPAPAPILQVDWIGTSMGGLIGMFLAAKPLSPIRRLVLNDVGPMVPWRGLARLKSIHDRLDRRFSSLRDAERALRKVCADFGPLADARWGDVVRHSVRRENDGAYALNYDPAILHSLNGNATAGIQFGCDFLTGVDLWPMWDAVRCPALVLRGGDSDLLLRSTAADMARRGPRAGVVEFGGVGHAPWLKSEDQIRIVREFLLAAHSEDHGGEACGPRVRAA
jgi:pimeloyl-ACP methyl ester carboxylesterase